MKVKYSNEEMERAGYDLLAKTAATWLCAHQDPDVRAKEKADSQLVDAIILLMRAVEARAQTTGERPQWVRSIEAVFHSSDELRERMNKIFRKHSWQEIDVE